MPFWCNSWDNVDIGNPRAREPKSLGQTFILYNYNRSLSESGFERWGAKLYTTVSVWHNNDGNQFRGWDLAAFERKVMFLTQYLSIVAQQPWQIKKLCCKSCMLLSCCAPRRPNLRLWPQRDPAFKSNKLKRNLYCWFIEIYKFSDCCRGLISKSRFKV